MTNPGQPPTSDAEWARDTENRLRRLESPNTMRIGPWVVSDRDGELIATRPGEEIVFGQLPEGDDDDTISDVTRGYITDQIDTIVDSITDPNPNGGPGIPKVKDFLSGKWDDIVLTKEVADAAITSGNNLVSNPGFEKSIFNHGDAVLTTAIRRTGTQSAMLVAGGGSMRKLWLICDGNGSTTRLATAGDIFYAESWVWGKSTNNQITGGANGIGIFIEVLDKDGVQIGQPITFTGPTASSALNNQWNRFYGYIAIPPTAPYNKTAMVRAYIALNTNVSSGSVYYFDDPILRVDSLVNSWSYAYDGANGTTGSLGKTPFDLFDPLKNLRLKALEGASGASGALFTAHQASQGASGALGMAQGAVDNIVIGLLNLTGQVYTPGDVLNASQRVASALSVLSTVTANLDAQRAAGMFYGVAINEPFVGYTAGSTPGSKWSLSASGSGSAVWQIAPSFVGGYGDNVAVMQPLSGVASRTARARLVAQSVTTFQRVGVVFFSAGGITAPAPSTDGRHAAYIYGRMSADHQRYIYAKFTGNTVSIGYNIGGGEVPFPESVQNYRYKAGVPYWLECGIGQSSPRTFRVWEGTTPITTGTDLYLSSANSDTDNLGGGFGGFSYDSRYAPARVAGFSLLDNVPPAIRGIGMRAFNLDSTRNFNVTGSPSVPVVGEFPANWFTLVEATDNVLYDASTSTFTASHPGWYLVKVSQKGSYETQTIFNNRMAVGIWMNTGSGQWLPYEVNAANQWSNIKESFWGVFVVYMRGGNQIRPRWRSMLNTTGNSFTGSTLGETAFTVSFLHNNFTPITEA